MKDSTTCLPRYSILHNNARMRARLGHESHHRDPSTVQFGANCEKLADQLRDTRLPVLRSYQVVLSRQRCQQGPSVWKLREKSQGQNRLRIEHKRNLNWALLN